MGTAHLVLVVDDSDVDLELTRVALEEDLSGEIADEFEIAVRTASNGRSALALLAAEGPYAVVVSDMQMPRMNGLELLEQVSELSPTTVRIMLTAHSDETTAIDAVNRGQVFRYLSRPCAPQTLRRAVRAGLERHRVVIAEQRLLSGTLTGAVSALADVLTIVSPEAFGRSGRIRRIVARLNEQLGRLDSWESETAAVLSQLGTISLPRELVRRGLRGDKMTRPELIQYQAQYGVAADLIERIPRLGGVAAIVRALGENRVPLAIRGPEAKESAIEIATDIVRVALEIERLTLTGHSAQDAIALTSTRRDLADAAVLEAVRGLNLSDIVRARPERSGAGLPLVS